MRQDPSIVIRGGTIVDGTGGPPVVADIAIVGDRITELGQVSERGAAAGIRALLVLLNLIISSEL